MQSKSSACLLLYYDCILSVTSHNLFMSSNHIAEIGQQLNRNWGDKDWVCRVLERMMNDIILEAGLVLTDYIEVIKFWMEEYKKRPSFYHIYSSKQEYGWFFQKLCICSMDIIEHMVIEQEEAVTIDYDSGVVVIFVDMLEEYYIKEVESKVDIELRDKNLQVITLRDRGIYDGTGMGYYRVGFGEPTTTAITVVSNNIGLSKKKNQTTLDKHLRTIKIRENVLRANNKSKKWIQTLLAPVEKKVKKVKSEVRVSEKWSVKKRKQGHINF